MTAGLHSGQVAGVVLTASGKTSHSAIIAAGLGIPVVVGCQEAQLQVQDGEPVFLDGHSGQLHWGLLPQEVDAFALMAQRNDRHMEQLSLLAGHPTRTADGTPVKLFANGRTLFPAKKSTVSDAMGLACFGQNFFSWSAEFLHRKKSSFFCINP